MKTTFSTFAAQASQVSGSVWMFLGSLLAFVLWFLIGWIVRWHEDFHLWPTSLLTWLTWGLVVLIQNSQNRHEIVLQKKLDELIRAVDKADNRLIGLEKQPPDVLDP